METAVSTGQSNANGKRASTHKTINDLVQLQE